MGDEVGAFDRGFWGWFVYLPFEIGIDVCRIDDELSKVKRPRLRPARVLRRVRHAGLIVVGRVARQVRIVSCIGEDIVAPPDEEQLHGC